MTNKETRTIRFIVLYYSDNNFVYAGSYLIIFANFVHNYIDNF